MFCCFGLGRLTAEAVSQFSAHNCGQDRLGQHSQNGWSSVVESKQHFSTSIEEQSTISMNQQTNTLQFSSDARPVTKYELSTLAALVEKLGTLACIAVSTTPAVQGRRGPYSGSEVYQSAVLVSEELQEQYKVRFVG